MIGKITLAAGVALYASSLTVLLGWMTFEASRALGAAGVLFAIAGALLWISDAA